MELLTVSEAALRLGVTGQRVRAMIKAGRLKAVNKGRFYLIRPQDLRQVIHRKPGRPKVKRAKAPKVSVG